MTGLGPISDYTSNYNLRLVNFDALNWGQYEHANWQIIDALLFNIIAVSNVQGIWENAISVSVGERYIDSDDGTMWEVLVAHTTASSPTTFSADRTANPTYWQAIGPLTPNYKGAWANDTDYSKNDFVSTSDYRYAVATVSHTSSSSPATIDDDIGNWEVLVDLGAAVTAAETAETNAETAETNAETAESNAQDWATLLGAKVGGTDWSAKAYAQKDLTGADGGSAKDWAQTAEDTEVTTGLYSAFHYMKKAEAFNSSDILDEDDFTSNSPTKAPSQQSTGAFVAQSIRVNNPPDMSDTGTDVYQFDAGADLATGDVFTADVGSANTTASPTLENTGGTPAGAQSIVDVEGNARIGMLEARPHRFLWDGTNYVVLDSSALQIPNSGIGPSLAFDTWRTPNADRPTLVITRTSARTNGTTSGSVTIGVDESGGTTADYTWRGGVANSNGGSGFASAENTAFIVPAGGAYIIKNEADPNASNNIIEHREYTL